MPWFQVVGIVIAGVVALIGVPKLVAETTAPWRLTHRMMSRAAAAEAAPAAGAKAVLLKEATLLSLQLAAVREIRYSARDKVAAVAGVAGILAQPAVAQAMIYLDVPSFVPEQLFDAVGGVLLVIAPAFAYRAIARFDTVRLQRQLFVDLAAPSSPIRRLAIPSTFDYMTRPTLSTSQVHARAARLEREGNVLRHRPADIDAGVHLLNVATAQLEAETYRRRPQKQ